MAYQFKKKFNGIERDKQTLSHNTEKTKTANSAFGETDINDLIPSKVIQDNIKENGIQKINLDLIKPRAINDFREISNVTLKASIKNLGLLDPILVRTSENNKYIIIAGHRRYNAYKEILADLKIQQAEHEKLGNVTQEINDKIKQFTSIPAIVFTVVGDQSDFLGKDPKYITSSQEEKIYQATNLENRQISKLDLAKHVRYFYDLIKSDPEFEKELLDKRNKDAKRKATKLNLPDEISKIIVKDEGFSVAPSYIWMLVSLIESEDEYKAYHKIAMQRIDNGEPVKTVYNDFSKALEIINYNFESKEIKQEYKTRIEKGNEPISEIYNELFDIKEKTKKQEKKVSKDKIITILDSVKKKEITLEEAIKEIKKL